MLDVCLRMFCFAIALKLDVFVCLIQNSVPLDLFSCRLFRVTLSSSLEHTYVMSISVLGWLVRRAALVPLVFRVVPAVELTALICDYAQPYNMGSSYGFRVVQGDACDVSTRTHSKVRKKNNNIHNHIKHHRNKP